MKKEDEIVLVVNRYELFENEKNAFQGSLFDKNKVSRFIEIISDNYTSMRRGAPDEINASLYSCAERHQGYKQPIPYIIITKGDKFFVTERLEGGGESRLHGKLSMGVGGHMNPIKGFDSFNALLTENTLRELHEELYVEENGDSIEINMNGLINDDVNEVGKVHIGLLGTINLKEGQDVSVQEVEQLKGSWYTLDELLNEDLFERLEAWGQITVQAIADGEIQFAEQLQ